MPEPTREAFAIAADAEAEELERLGVLPTDIDRDIHVIALRLAAKGGWRPISEAPKDGTWMDLWAGSDRIPDARFWNGRWESIIETEDNSVMRELIVEPTHFMPLPPPPSAGQEMKDE